MSHAIIAVIIIVASMTYMWLDQNVSREKVRNYIHNKWLDLQWHIAMRRIDGLELWYKIRAMFSFKNIL